MHTNFAFYSSFLSFCVLNMCVVFDFSLLLPFYYYFFNFSFYFIHYVYCVYEFCSVSHFWLSQFVHMGRVGLIGFVCAGMSDALNGNGSLKMAIFPKNSVHIPSVKCCHLAG